MNAEQKKKIEKLAWQGRYNAFVQMKSQGFGHVGGCMSIAEVLAVLFGGMMKVDPKNPKWDERDNFVCSKGHAGPGVYGCLCAAGFFPEEWLPKLNHAHSPLPSHCDRHVPGIDISTGSLGQGLSVAVGIAHGRKMMEKDGYVYCIVGDGEAQEGMIWEGIMAGNKLALDNLILFIDDNKGQCDGPTDEILPLDGFEDKLKLFGWHAQTVDGHDVEAIWNAIELAKKATGKPSVIVLETKKGAGYPPIEEMNPGNNHHMDIPAELGEAAMAYFQAEIDKRA